jgi:hypothetical protein
MDLTPNDVARNLIDLSKQLDSLIELSAQLDRDAVNAKIDADVAEAHAFLKAEGSVDARRAQSRIVTESERRAAELSNAALRACRDRVKALQVRIDTGRSLSALVRAEASL